MKINVYLQRLVSAGINPEQIPGKSDADLLKVRGFGRTGLRLVRNQYGRDSSNESFEEQVQNALRPVLLKRRGVGPKEIRRISRVVAAYFT